MRRDQKLELADELSVATELELGLEKVDLRGQVQLGEPADLVPGGALEDDIRERRAAPEPERAPAKLDGTVGRRGASLRDQALELEQVERVGLDSQPVAGRLRDERVGADVLAQRMDVALHELRRRRGWPLTPEVVHEAGAGDDLVRVQEQDAE